MTAFNHRQAQRNKPERIARRRRISFGNRIRLSGRRAKPPANMEAKPPTGKQAKA